MRPMSPDGSLTTRQTQLSRLRNLEDQESWRTFFDRYWELLYNVARRSGLGEPEAQDVVQEIGSWKASTPCLPCIGTMNLQPVRRHAKVLPASCRSTLRFVESPLAMFTVHWDHEPKMRNLFICKRGIL